MLLPSSREGGGCLAAFLAVCPQRDGKVVPAAVESPPVSALCPAAPRAARWRVCVFLFVILCVLHPQHCSHHDTPKSWRTNSGGREEAVDYQMGARAVGELEVFGGEGGATADPRTFHVSVGGQRGFTADLVSCDVL